jgi:hypothetical protein
MMSTPLRDPAPLKPRPVTVLASSSAKQSVGPLAIPVAGLAHRGPAPNNHTAQISALPLRQPALTARETFALAVRGVAPKDEMTGALRLDGLRKKLAVMTAAQRSSIASDENLIRQAQIYVGGSEFVSLLAAVGMCATTFRGGVEVALHMTGAEADAFVRAAMGAVPHLRPYLQAALESGRRAEVI